MYRLRYDYRVREQVETGHAYSEVLIPFSLQRFAQRGSLLNRVVLAQGG